MDTGAVSTAVQPIWPPVHGQAWRVLLQHVQYLATVGSCNWILLPEVMLQLLRDWLMTLHDPVLFHE